MTFKNASSRDLFKLKKKTSDLQICKAFPKKKLLIKEVI